MRGTIIKTFGLLLAVVAGTALLVNLLVASAFGQPIAQAVTLLSGESVRVTCADGGQINATFDSAAPTVLTVLCGVLATAQPTATTPPAEPTATNTPEPQPTATAAPTETPVAMSVDMLWHPPMTHGDRPAHEHGDPPPSWVLDYLGVSEVGAAMLFTHAASTPGENVANYKHTAFKGWAGRFTVASGPVDWYGVFHLDTNPAGQGGRFHSYQLWARDPSGNVSHWNGWLDFGTGNNTGSQKIVVCGQDSGIRPIILVNRAGCPVRFENWYARAGGSGAWAPDFGFNINPTYFDIGSGDPNDPATWRRIGDYPANLNRRIEWAWYPFRSGQRGAFYATQFGEVVSGIDAPVCGTERTIGSRSYTVLCLAQYIAPTMPEVSFNTVTSQGRNSVQRTFDDGNGVSFPN